MEKAKNSKQNNKSIIQLMHDIQNKQLTTLSLIFSGLAVFVTILFGVMVYLQVNTGDDIKTAIKELETRKREFDTAVVKNFDKQGSKIEYELGEKKLEVQNVLNEKITELNRLQEKIEASYLKPAMIVLWDKKEVPVIFLEAHYHWENGSNQVTKTLAFQLKNIGQKSTNISKLRMRTREDIWGYSGYGWIVSQLNTESDFNINLKYNLGEDAQLNADETIEIELPKIFLPSDYQFGVTECLIEVFYENSVLRGKLFIKWVKEKE